ncbi:MAG: hypothetical protein M3357_11340 [Actinomycetota bacterium]|nr:hypothetical protein [Actinomycetota bacterium]
MKLRRIGATVVVMGLALAACGKAAEVVAPRLAVREAAQTTFDENRGRFTLSVVGDEADMATLFEVPEEDRRYLDVLRKGRIVVSLDGGDQDSTDDDRFALGLDVGDVDGAIEVRMVDKTMYVRGDVAGLARLFEADAGALSSLVAGAREAGFGFVADAVAGRWLSVDLAPLEAMANGVAQQRGGELPDMGSAQFSKLLEAVSKTFGEDVDVKRLDQEDAGQHYRLTVPVRRVYERLAPVFGELFASVPGMALPPATEVPDRTISLDVWTSDGRINRAELDLGQFAPQPPAGRVALRVEIDELDGDIKPPGDAVEVDVMQIFGQLMAGLGTIQS